MPKTPVLMTRDNPDGWKLEELLAVLKTEIAAKSEKLRPVAESDDLSPENMGKREAAKRAVANNGRIIEHLELCEAFQRSTLDGFATLGPDQGPTGTPRL